MCAVTSRHPLADHSYNNCSERLSKYGQYYSISHSDLGEKQIIHLIFLSS